MRTILRLFSFPSICLLTMGCNRNPNVEIIGSYFPGWMISLALGVVLTGLAHMTLRRQRLIQAVGHPALIYPSMVVLFTCLIWLCFFA